MNGAWFIGRVVRVEMVEKESGSYWKVRIASRAMRDNIFITIFVFTDEQPAHVGDLVFAEGELVPVGDGFYLSANRFVQLKEGKKKTVDADKEVKDESNSQNSDQGSRIVEEEEENSGNKEEENTQNNDQKVDNDGIEDIEF